MTDLEVEAFNFLIRIDATYPCQFTLIFEPYKIFTEFMNDERSED